MAFCEMLQSQCVRSPKQLHKDFERESKNALPNASTSFRAQSRCACRSFAETAVLVSPKEKRMARRPSQATNTKLGMIRAAADLFHKQGAHLTTPEEVVKAAGTTSRTRKALSTMFFGHTTMRSKTPTARSTPSTIKSLTGETWRSGSPPTSDCKNAF